MTLQERTFTKSGHSERAVAGPLNICISKFLDIQNKKPKTTYGLGYQSGNSVNVQGKNPTF